MLTAILLAALATAPASAAHPSTVAFQIAERDLFPESVAWDPADGSFYVGSMRLRKIVRVGRDGSASDFVKSKQDGLWSVIGIKIDPERRELWANACSADAEPKPLMIDHDPAEAGRTALHRYDLKSGKLIARYAPLDPPPSLCFNDLAFGRGGDVYLSAGMGGVWRLPAGGASVEKFLDVPDDYVNGIATSEDGRTLFIARHMQGVVAVDPSTKAARLLDVPAGADLRGIDGLYVRRNALVAVQNGGEKARILRAPLTKDGRGVERVDVLDQDHPDFAVPTTGVVVGDDLYYVATSQLDAIDRKTGEIPPVEKLRKNIVLKLALPK